MRTIRFLLEKEFRQIFRDSNMLRVLIALPIIQLLLLPFAANFEVKNINLVVVDHDRSTESQELIQKVASSAYFKLVDYKNSYQEALPLMDTDEADLILEIPDGFEKDVMRNSNQGVFVAVNAVNGVKANLGSAYLSNILLDYNQNLLLKLNGGQAIPMQRIEVDSSNWFNPNLNYHLFIVPGILAMLVTLLCGFFSSINIVKEKEKGTMEQINVSPIKKWQFILGKLIPFWVIGMVMFSVGLVIAYFVYGIVSVGSLWVLYLFLVIYIIGILGFGLLVSNFCETQQQAIFVMFFFMLVFILLSGLFTSIDSMPTWTKMLTFLNPVKYFIEVLRLIVLKGSGIREIMPNLLVISGFAIVLNFLAIQTYQKTS